MCNNYSRIRAAGRGRRNERARPAEIAIGERPPGGPRLRIALEITCRVYNGVTPLPMLTQTALREAHKYES